MRAALFGKATIFLHLALLLPANVADGEKEICQQQDESCTGVSINEAMVAGYIRPDPMVPMKPTDLPPLTLFSNWTNSTIHVESTTKSIDLSISTGAIQQIGFGNHRKSEFTTLNRVVTREEVQAIRSIAEHVPLDREPDTVDGFASQEFFVHTYEMDYGMKAKDVESDEIIRERQGPRDALQKIMQPILDERITPFINQKYPDLCQKSPSRKCTPCFSLVRRYKKGERTSHAPHRDGHALVTAVVSLSEYGADYRGGLYVGSAQSSRYYVGLQLGDAVVHTSELLHGVKVYPIELDDSESHAERWSWILWYQDSATCEHHGGEWYQDCAEGGDPTCAYLQSMNYQISDLGFEQKLKDFLMYVQRAADHGIPQSCNKMAAMYLKLLASPFDFNLEKGRQYYERAISSANDPVSHYGMANFILNEMKDNPHDYQSLDRAIAHLEAAALNDHPFSMFNLGIVHCFGYGSAYLDKAGSDFSVGGQWFEQSGLPEGLAARGGHLEMNGQVELGRELVRRAKSLGFGTKWRKESREGSGAGDGPGLDLNLKWPPNRMNMRPPVW